MTGDNPPEHNLYIGWVGLAVLALCVTGWNRRTFPLLVITFVVPWLTFILPGSRLLAFPFLRTQGALTRLAMSALFAPSRSTARLVGPTGAIRRRGRIAGLPGRGLPGIRLVPRQPGRRSGCLLCRSSPQGVGSVQRGADLRGGKEVKSRDRHT